MIFKKYLIALLVFGSTYPVFAARPTKILTTTVNFFQPSTTPASAKPGFCWMHSIKLDRADAWRCVAINEIYDPCFTIASSNLSSIVCGVDPSENNKGFLLKLTQPMSEKLAVTPLKNSAKAKVWLVNLQDGKVCSPYSGTMPMVWVKGQEMMIVQYSCEDDEGGESSGLLADSIIPGRIWYAQKVTYLSVKSKIKVTKVQNVALKEVWQ